MTIRKHELFIPDNSSQEKAFEKTTDFGVVAHADDLEMMCCSAITNSYNSNDKVFSGLVLTNGSGASNIGQVILTESEMVNTRILEQNQAASIGRYGFIAQLGYSSLEAKDQKNKDDIVEALSWYISRARPDRIYIHNLADKHSTHVVASLRVLDALRSLKDTYKPKKLLACEIWRNLDWLSDKEKVALPVLNNKELIKELIQNYKSQIFSGKRYDLALLGRLQANATFLDPYSEDTAPLVSFAMDVTHLIDEPREKTLEFIDEKISTFRNDVVDTIKTYL